MNLAVAYLGEIPNLTNVLVSHKYTNASLFTKFTEEIWFLNEHANLIFGDKKD